MKTLALLLGFGGAVFWLGELLWSLGVRDQDLLPFVVAGAGVMAAVAVYVFGTWLADREIGR